MSSENRPTLVSDIMVRDVATISAMATLREAMREMRRAGVKSLVVEKSHPHDALGIVTYTSILRTIVAEEGDIDLVNVYDVCSKPVITVSADMEVKYVARLMVSQGYRRIVVLDHNQLAGIISMNDIVGTILEMLDNE
ncbi:MAG: CBS domain-containing protein [Halothiobacillaceae bacterium]|jgi:predicted transcriptional regulator|nr:CBS domain-containing protein [Halothiobacillaceae bacterium]MDY0050352.1 CBS domain-containing protein [Halothiobacillaceae bacterium]